MIKPILQTPVDSAPQGDGLDIAKAYAAATGGDRPVTCWFERFEAYPEHLTALKLLEVACSLWVFWTHSTRISDSTSFHNAAGQCQLRCWSAVEFLCG